MVKIKKISIKKGSASVKKALKKNKEEKRFELNSKELKINLDRLQKDAKAAYNSMMKVVPESIKDVEIKRFGNASHIILPKKYSGKKATVIIRGK
jgi:putative transposon-encoded protein